MEKRLKPAVIAAIVAALVLGLLLGGAFGLTRRLFGGGPDATSIAASSLQSMRAQNRLVPFVARYVSVVSSRKQELGVFTTERTLVLPGDVRYELDLSKLTDKDVAWDAATNTLSVTLPPIEIAGPEVDLPAAREFGQGGLVSSLTNSTELLDTANRDRAIADLRRQAGAEVPMTLARQAARQAVEQSFVMPLRAAGLANARVVATFAGETPQDPSYLDRSRSYDEVLRENRARQQKGE